MTAITIAGITSTNGATAGNTKSTADSPDTATSGAGLRARDNVPEVTSSDPASMR